MRRMRGRTAPALLSILALAGAWTSPQEPPATPSPGPVEIPGWRCSGDAGRSRWKLGTAAPDPADPHKILAEPGGRDLVNTAGHGCDLCTEQTWGDVRIEAEVMVAKDQSSALYVMGEYAVQILDSFGKPAVGQGDLGGLWGVAGPRVNASKPAGEWQKLVIQFEAPRFDAGGKKIRNARFTRIELNGVVIHENVEMAAPTPGGLTGKEGTSGPVLLQGSRGMVSFRIHSVEPPRSPR